jgi:hypothetical protein
MGKQAQNVRTLTSDGRRFLAHYLRTFITLDEAERIIHRLDSSKKGYEEFLRSLYHGHYEILTQKCIHKIPIYLFDQARHESNMADLRGFGFPNKFFCVSNLEAIDQTFLSLDYLWNRSEFIGDYGTLLLSGASCAIYFAEYHQQHALLLA